MTITEPTTHETIAEYLARGGQMAQHPDMGRLVELACYDLPTYGAERCREFPAKLLADLQRIGVESLPPLTPEGEADREAKGETREQAATRMMSQCRWELEVIDCPEVATAMLATAPADFVAEQRAVCAADVETERQPFALELRDVGAYRCGFTGQECDGMAVVVEGRGWIADELCNVADRLVFSPAALTLFLEASCATWRASDPAE